MSEVTGKFESIACPRCGYDLRGVIGTWEDSCPISGICAECGLDFEWGELLSPRRMRPRWCVEYARGWTIVPASFKTLLVLFFRPWKFWRDLKMTHEPSWRKIPAIAIPILLICYLIFALNVGYDSYHHYTARKNAFAPTPLEPIEIGIYATVNPYSDYGKTSGFASPRDFARRFRPFDIFRNIQAAIRTNTFLNPWRKLNPRGFSLRQRTRHSVFLGHGIILVVLCPLAFLALPQSLRKAKVRWRHIVRICLYSVASLAPPFALFMHLQIANWMPRSWFLHQSAFLLFLFPAAALIIWWSLAAKHYLKLPHAWGVGSSVVVLAYASGLFAITLIDFFLI